MRHDKKKQGIAKSVSSKNYMKERKAKPKEMKNIARNAWRSNTNPAIENSWQRKKKSLKRQKKSSRIEDTHG